MGIRKIVKLFDKGNVCIFGKRGRGKDVLMSNVIARRKKDYICNVDYHIKGCKHYPLNLADLDPNNSYNNFITHKFKPFKYKYNDGIDAYVSDAGIYFPSQYSGNLDKQYPGLSVYQAISRHLGDCNFHVNTQALSRVWNKIREQSDIYVKCCWCKVIFGKIVVMRVITYDRYNSADQEVEPYKHIHPPMLSKQEVKAQYRSRDEVLYRQFKQTYGNVKSHLLIFFNRSKFDSRFIKSLLES